MYSLHGETAEAETFLAYVIFSSFEIYVKKLRKAQKNRELYMGWCIAALLRLNIYRTDVLDISFDTVFLLRPIVAILFFI